MRALPLTFTAAAGLVLLSLAGSVHAEELRTTQCSKYGHPEFSFQVKSEAIPEVDRQWLVKTLEEKVAAGAKFKPGETLQLGWMITRIESAPDGTLRLHEPDMHMIKVRFTDSVDATLRTLRSQKDTVESFGEKIPLTFTSLAHSIIVPPGFQTLESFALERHEPEGRDSGWIMVAGDGSPSEEELATYKPVSLYEFGLRRKDLLHLLALPPGTVVEMPARGARSYFLKEKPLTARAGSYVEQLDASVHRQRGYRARLEKHVTSTWKAPKGILAGTQCPVYLRVTPTGEIKGQGFMDGCPSDTKLFDSILDAIRKAGPGPAVENPVDYRELVTVTFAVPEETH